MKSVVRILSAILFVLISAGCSDPVHQTLERLDRAMDSSPDSVLTRLQAIDSAHIHGERDRAYYALLLTEANYKNYRPIGDCNLVNIAVNYYERHNDPKKYMKSLFYKGFILKELGERDSAVLYAVPALDMAQEAKDNYWIGKTAELMGLLYAEDYDNREMAIYDKLAADGYAKAGKITNHRFSLCDYLHRMGHISASGNYLKSLDSLRRCCQDDTLVRYLKPFIMKRMLTLAVKIRNYDLARSLIDSIRMFSSDVPLENADYLNMGMTALGQGEIEEARGYIEKIDTTKVNGRELSALLALKTLYNLRLRNYSEGYALADSNMMVQNRVVEEALNQTVKTIGRSYYKSEAQKKEAQQQNLRQYLLIGSIILGIIILAAIIIISYRTRIRKLELNEKIREIFSLNESLESLNESYGEVSHIRESLNEELSHTLKEKQELSEQSVIKDLKIVTTGKLLVRLIEKHAEVKDSTDGIRLEKKVISEIKRLAEKSALKSQEKLLNERIDNIIKDLRTQCPFLKDTDIDFLLILTYGLPVKIVSIAFDTTTSTIYSLKRRIAEKIMMSDAPDKERFITFLDL